MIDFITSLNSAETAFVASLYLILLLCLYVCGCLIRAAIEDG